METDQGFFFLYKNIFLQTVQEKRLQSKLDKYKIYALTFTKEKDNLCYLYISTADVYHTDWWSGYFKYKGKMITVNEFDKDCSIGLINDKYLLTSVEGDYHDQN